MSGDMCVDGVFSVGFLSGDKVSIRLVTISAVASPKYPLPVPVREGINVTRVR